MKLVLSWGLCKRNSRGWTMNTHISLVVGPRLGHPNNNVIFV